MIKMVAGNQVKKLASVLSTESSSIVIKRKLNLHTSGSVELVEEMI